MICQVCFQNEAMPKPEEVSAGNYAHGYGMIPYCKSCLLTALEKHKQEIERLIKQIQENNETEKDWKDRNW